MGLWFGVLEKRFHTRGTLRSIKISKIPILYLDRLSVLN